MPLDHRTLAYAITVARFGSFARAAKSLGVTQPGLSRAVQALEISVGAPLFDRSAKGVSPTPRGRKFLARAAEILADLQALEEETADISNEAPAVLFIGLGPIMASVLGSSSISALLTARPNLDVQIFVDFSDRLASMLRAGEIEFLVASGGTFAHDPDLRVVPLPRLPLACYARKGHALSAGAPVSPAQVLAHRTAIVSAGSQRVPLIAGIRAMFGVAPRLVLANHVEALRELVSETDTVGIEPEMMIVPEIERGRFARVHVAGPLPSVEPVIAWNGDHSLSDEALELVRLLAKSQGVDITAPS